MYHADMQKNGLMNARAFGVWETTTVFTQKIIQAYTKQVKETGKVGEKENVCLTEITSSVVIDHVGMLVLNKSLFHEICLQIKITNINKFIHLYSSAFLIPLFFKY